jgi:hypothetical protein
VLVVHKDQAEAVCKNLIERFDREMPQLYDEEDRKKGYIEGKTRQGQVARFPFVGVALVVVSTQYRTFNHPAEVSAVASELKTWAKSSGKSAYVVDRRKSSEKEISQ